MARQPSTNEAHYDLSSAEQSGSNGFLPFRDEEDRRHYFILFDNSGQAILSSQAYSSARSRDQGMQSVVRWSGDPTLYSRYTEDEGRTCFFELMAPNHRVIGRSRNFAEQAAMEAVLTWCVTYAPSARTLGAETDAAPESETTASPMAATIAAPAETSDAIPNARQTGPHDPSPDTAEISRAMDIDESLAPVVSAPVSSLDDDLATRELPLLPGMEVVGRGIYLRPSQPYQLKRYVFPRANYHRFYSTETGETYQLPDGFAVNNSPPIPSGRAHNQTVIDESWERLDKRTSLEVGLAAGHGLFTVSASSNQSQQLRSHEDSYYASRTSFVPLWTVYVTDSSPLHEDIFDLDVPVPFEHRHRQAYERFFARFGSHYVTRAWIGGSATITFRVAKSSEMSKDEIQAGLKASYMGSGAAVNSSAQDKKEKLSSQSECTVYGKGGNEQLLASMDDMDGTLYQQWLESVTDNPQAIEIEAAGIWTLMTDRAKADALRAAYAEANVFKPVSALFELNKKIFFWREDTHFSYDTVTEISVKPMLLQDERCRWRPLVEVGFDSIDAALGDRFMRDSPQQEMENNVFFFQDDEYVQYDTDTDQIVDGAAKKIADGWPGVTFTQIDAVLSADYEHIYFFSGDEYIRFNVANHCADEGYPQPIRKRWFGMTFERIDAALYWGKGKVYFFSGSYYIRYDMLLYRTDAGYPKSLLGSYVEDWKFFD